MKHFSLLLAGWLLPAVSCHTSAADVPVNRLARIALVSDTHTTRGTKEDQPLYKGRFNKVIAEVNAAKVDLVLVAGDLTQDGKPQEIADFKEQIKGFHPPVWFVPGNHDIGNKRLHGKPDEVTAWRVKRFEMRMGPACFARDLGGVRVIGINSPILGSRLPAEQEMWEFLETEISKPTTKPTLFLSHYPPFTKKPDEPGGDYWNIEPEPRKRLFALLKKAGVKAWLTGHLHRELVNHLESIPIVTTPPVSFGLPKGKQREGWTLVTVAADGEVRTEFRHVTDSTSFPR